MVEIGDDKSSFTLSDKEVPVSDRIMASPSDKVEVSQEVSESNVR